jgi:hypothetical protein
MKNDRRPCSITSEKGFVAKWKQKKGKKWYSAAQSAV